VKGFRKQESFCCAIRATFLQKVQGELRCTAARFKLEAFAGAGLTIIQGLHGMLIGSNDPSLLSFPEYAGKQSQGVRHMELNRGRPVIADRFVQAR
jgi:hypothetical protein